MLAGCDANPKPAPLPTEGVTSTPASTLPTPPTMPAQAQGTSKAAAKAFVRHYFVAINYASSTGESAYLRELSDPECASCAAIAGNIADIYASGGSIQSDGWRIRSITAVPLQDARTPVFDVGVFMTPETVVAEAGAPSKGFDGGKQPMTIYLKRTNNGWLVVRLDKVT